MRVWVGCPLTVRVRVRVRVMAMIALMIVVWVRVRFGAGPPFVGGSKKSHELAIQVAVDEILPEQGQG